MRACACTRVPRHSFSFIPLFEPNTSANLCFARFSPPPVEIALLKSRRDVRDAGRRGIVPFFFGAIKRARRR